jgi:hypothetical protein
MQFPLDPPSPLVKGEYKKELLFLGAKMYFIELQTAVNSKLKTYNS